MNIWQVLEITRTNDKKAVKRAYAKLLKLHKPELDPEGYQHLRDAYDKAIDYCKNRHEKPVNNIRNNIIAENPSPSVPLTALSEDNSVNLNDFKPDLEKESAAVTEPSIISYVNNIELAVDKLFSIESSKEAINFFTDLLKSDLLLNIKNRKLFSIFAIGKGINWDDELEYPSILFDVMANTLAWFDINTSYDEFSDYEIERLQLRIKAGLEYLELVELSKKRAFFSRESADIRAARLILGEYRPGYFSFQAFIYFNHSYNAIKKLIDKFTLQYSLTLCPQLDTPSFQWWQKRLNRHAYSVIDVIIATILVFILTILNDTSVIKIIDLSIDKYAAYGIMFVSTVIFSIIISWTINTIFKWYAYISSKFKVFYEEVKQHIVSYWQSIKYRPLVYYGVTSLYMFIFVMAGYLDNTRYDVGLLILGSMLLFIMLEAKIIILCIAYIPYAIVRTEMDLVDFPLILNYVFVLIALLTITGFEKLQHSELAGWITGSTFGVIINVCIIASLVSFILLKSLSYIVLL